MTPNGIGATAIRHVIGRPVSPLPTLMPNPPNLGKSEASKRIGTPPSRPARMSWLPHTCSVVFLARVARAAARAGDDAAVVEWVADWSKADLAFDHAAILADAARMLRTR